MAKHMKTLMRIVGYGLLVLCIVVAGALVYLQTPTGKALLARVISHQASDPATGMALQVTDIQGSVPLDMRIGRITLADTQGVYLELRGLHLAWSPLALLHDRVHINALEVQEVHLIRLPQGAPKPEKNTQPFQLPHLPSLMLDRLSVPEILIEKGVAGQQERLQLSGGGTNAAYRLNLTTLEGPPTMLAATLNAGDDRMSAKLELDEATGGLIGHMLALPQGATLHAALDAAMDAEGKVQLKDVAVDAGQIHLGGSGSYALNTQALDAQLALAIPDVNELSALAHTPLAGDLHATFAFKGTPDALHVTTDIHSNSLSASGRQLGNVHLQSTLVVDAKDFTGSGDVSFDGFINGMKAALAMQGKVADGVASISQFDGAYGPYALSGSGDVALKDRHFHVAIQSRPVAFHVLVPESSVKGEAALSISAEGTPDAITAKADASLTSLSGDSKIHATGDMDVKAMRFTGDVEGSFTRDAYAFTLHAPVDATQARVDVSGFALKGDGIALTGKAAYDIPAMLADGTLQLDARDLQPLGRLFGIALAGQAKAAVTLNANNGMQQVQMQGSVDHIHYEKQGLENAGFAVNARDAKALEGISVKLDASGITAGSAQIHALHLAANGGLSGTLAASADVEGTASGTPFNAEAALQGSRDSHDPQHVKAVLNTLKGAYDGTPVALKAPVHLTMRKDTVTVSPLVLALAGGKVQLDAEATPAKVHAAFAVANLHLQELPGVQLPEGVFNSTLTVSGTMAAPNAAFTGNIVLASDVPVTVTARGTWAKHTLAAHLQASGQKIHMVADVSLAAPLSFAPLTLGIDGGTSIHGKATADAALDAFNGFLRASNQHIGGALSGNASIGGRLDALNYSAHVALANGQYDYKDNTVCLRGLNMRVAATQDAVSLEALHASSQDNGTVAGNARLALGGAQALQGSLAFHRFHLFCGGMASGDVDGTLLASGSLHGATLGGALTLSPLNVELPGAGGQATAIPQVKTVRMDARKKAKKAAAQEAKPFPLTLHVTVNVPEKLFVRGRGLDAEFEGKLEVTGPATAPQVEGTFTTRRGTFMLLDRQMTLSSGTIRFEGPIPPSPFLDIQATTIASTTTVNVSLSGSAAKPELTLTSTPALPQDEILALLLFGRQLSSLSPFQVVQLAQSTAELAGYGGGGAISKVRSLLGVDTLNVGSDANNDVSVGAGKYITDKIYVGTTQGATPQSRAVTTEVSVYPHISANTSINQSGQQSLGLQWKYDY
jgi:translocation and assembly module TamB